MLTEGSDHDNRWVEGGGGGVAAVKGGVDLDRPFKISVLLLTIIMLCQFLSVSFVYD